MMPALTLIAALLNMDAMLQLAGEPMSMPSPRVVIDSAQSSVRVSIALPMNLAQQLPEGRVPATDGERWIQLTLLDVADSSETPPILGRYERDASTLTFVPRFSLSPGSRYQVVITLPGQPPQRQQFQMPTKQAGPPPELVAVYPTANVLPANLLKFYLHFSQPMREGPDIFDQIQILDSKGVPIEDPWRRTELWNDDGTRLTLWIHPGRIKVGVNLREQLGPVLKPNRHYTLRIPTTMLDATGRRLTKEFRKPFHTDAALRDVVPDHGWMATLPPAGTRQPLELLAPRPLDHALFERSVAILAGGNQPVSGRCRILPGEQTWSIIPEKPWLPGNYVLQFHERLEDLSGNTFIKPFDHDLELPKSKHPRLTFPIELKQNSQQLPLGESSPLPRNPAQ